MQQVTIDSDVLDFLSDSKNPNWKNVFSPFSNLIQPKMKVVNLNIDIEDLVSEQLQKYKLDKLTQPKETISN